MESGNRWQKRWMSCHIYVIIRMRSCFYQFTIIFSFFYASHFAPLPLLLCAHAKCVHHHIVRLPTDAHANRLPFMALAITTDMYSKKPIHRLTCVLAFIRVLCWPAYWANDNGSTTSIREMWNWPIKWNPVAWPGELNVCVEGFKL